MTPLRYALQANNEECVRVLINAGCLLSESDWTSIPSRVLKLPRYERVLKLVKGDDVPLPPSKEKKHFRGFKDEAAAAAVEGVFTDFLDTSNVEISVFSEVLLCPQITSSVDLCLQALWCGANVNIVKKGVTPLCSVILSSSLEVMKALLKSNANIDVTIPRDSCPPHKARPMEEIVEALLEAKANPGDRALSRSNDEEYTVLHMAYVCATDIEKCRLLVKKVRDERKNSPRMTAAEEKCSLYCLKTYNFYD